jgi:hypothetical protein
VSARASITAVLLCAVLAAAPTVRATGVPVVVTATAFETGGTQPDVFSLTYTCAFDVRILQVTWDMTPSAGHLFFDTAPSGSEGYDFHTLPDAYFPGFTSTASVLQHFSADNSPQLAVQFTSFNPGNVLYFDIDVDGPLSTTFTPADFAGTSLSITFDPSPAFPGAQPVGVVYPFFVSGASAAAFGERDVPVNFGQEVPEPATVLLLASGGAMLMVRRRRR